MDEFDFENENFEEDFAEKKRKEKTVFMSIVAVAVFIAIIFIASSVKNFHVSKRDVGIDVVEKFADDMKDVDFAPVKNFVDVEDEGVIQDYDVEKNEIRIKTEEKVLTFPISKDGIEDKEKAEKLLKDLKENKASIFIGYSGGNAYLLTEDGEYLHKYIKVDK